ARWSASSATRSCDPCPSGGSLARSLGLTRSIPTRRGRGGRGGRARRDRLCRLAKVPVVCAHRLRGTHASLAEAVGISSHAVANSLGHESVRTTHGHGHYTSPDAIASV